MKKFELIVPYEWDIFEQVKKIFEEKYSDGVLSDYAWAEHDKDLGHAFHHYHIGGFIARSNFAVEAIHKWFSDFEKILPNSIEKIRGSKNSYVTYLLHLTVDAKSDGKLPPITKGGSVDFDECLKEYDEYVALDLDNLLSNIIDGKIREYQFYQNKKLLDAVIHNNMLKKVTDSFALFYENYHLGANVNIDRKQFWISGLSGNGKTTLAKYAICQLGYTDNDIYVTSAGKNVFDDYKGQPCIIVDDVDKDSLTPKAALKLLDMFTKSMSPARYHNKAICADVICFTSTVTPVSWWKKVADDKIDGNLYQLLRRLNYGSWRINADMDYDVCIELYDGFGQLLDKMQKPLPDDVYEKVVFGCDKKRTNSTVSVIDKIFNSGYMRYCPWDNSDLEV